MAVLHLVSMVVAVIGVVAGVTLGALLLTGKVAIVAPETVTAEKSKVCSKELIAQYNRLPSINDSDEMAQQYEDIIARVDQTEERGAADPNCVFMRYSIALARGESDEVLGGHYDTLARLAGNGHFASSELFNIMTVEDIGLSLGKIALPEDEAPTDGAG